MRGACGDKNRSGGWRVGLFLSGYYERAFYSKMDTALTFLLLFASRQKVGDRWINGRLYAHYPR